MTLLEVFRSPSASDSVPREPEIVQEMVRLLAEAPKPGELADRLHRRLAEHLGCELFLYHQYEPDRAALTLAGHRGLTSEEVAAMESLCMEEFMSGATERPEKARYFEHVQHSDSAPLAPLRALGVRAVCHIPLITDQHVWGSALFATRQRDRLTERERKLLETLADLLMTSCERASTEDERKRQLSNEREARRELQQSMSALRGLNDTLEGRVARRTHDLVRYQSQLRSLVSDLILTEQRERRRIAGELHDHLAQLLVACKMKMGIARNQARKQSLADDDEGSCALFDEIDGYLDQSLSYTRTLIAQISPVLLFEQGLVPALYWLAETVMPRHGLNVTVREMDDLPDEMLEEDVRIMLFESARELLFNVLRHAGTDHAEVRIARHDGGLALTVSDHGQGFVVNDARLEDAKLHGFGLFSIRERMGLLGGGLELTSTPGQGTTATLWTPLRLEASTPVNLPPHTGTVDVKPVLDFGSGARSSTVRVLVVDDHAVVREGLMMMLGKEDDLLVVGEADSGHTALSLVPQVAPHIVLMDVSMPDMDGIEATAELTAQHPDVKVIGLSMYEDESVAASMRGAGAVDYLCKGCSAERLTDAINKALGRQQHNDSSETVEPV